MGGMIQARCACGYESDIIGAGGGFLNFTDTCDAPALCPDCRILVVRNYANKFSRCPDCGKKVIFYNDPVLQITSEKPGDRHGGDIFNWFVEKKNERFRLPDTEYLCPACGEFEMRFFDCGCWD